jgi:hypothetical protein
MNVAQTYKPHNIHREDWRIIAQDSQTTISAFSPSLACGQKPEIIKVKEYSRYYEAHAKENPQVLAKSAMIAPSKVACGKRHVALSAGQRKEMLLKSYAKSSLREGNNPSVGVERNLFEELAALPFNDALVQQDSADSSLDISTWYDKDIVLMINKDMSDAPSDDVVFSIYHGQKLLVCDEMPLNELVREFSASIKNAE